MASIPAYAAPAFLEFVSAHAAKGDPDAQRLIDRVKPGKRIPKPSAPGKSRDDRRQERIASRVALRALCDARAAGKCEVCGRTDLRLELDHLVSGSVRKEDPTAALMACVDCHRAKHRSDVPTLRAYKEACLRLFLHAGFHEIDRRLKKAERIASR